MTEMLIAGVNAMVAYYWDETTNKVYQIIDKERVLAKEPIATIVRDKIAVAKKTNSAQK